MFPGTFGTFLREKNSGKFHNAPPKGAHKKSYILTKVHAFDLYLREFTVILTSGVFSFELKLMNGLN